jgi:hypothetical protein
MNEKILKMKSSMTKLLNSKRIWDSNVLLFVGVLIVVFISRLPFLFPGYGIDPDAWGVVMAARQISSSGQYVISRFPGYPFQEYVYSLFWQAGPLVMNGLTALLSGCAASFLALSIKKLGGRYAVLTAFVFAFIPVVYINSVNSLDYIWAICFILGSLTFLLNDHMLISGLFLGLAIGTRITSGAVLLPFMILYLIRGGHKVGLAKYISVGLLIGGICYLPVYLKYGIGFLKFSDPQQILLNAIIRFATVYVWGLVGIATIGILLLFSPFIFRARDRTKKLSSYTLVWLLTISLYFIAYLRLPHDSGYLIPALPFFLILINQLLNKKILAYFSLGILLSPFLFSFEFTNDMPGYTWDVNFYRWHIYVHPFAGPIIQDHIYRSQEVQLYQNILRFNERLDRKSVFIVGWNMPKFTMLSIAEDQNEIKGVYAEFLTPADIQQYLNEGEPIYYLPELSDTSRELYGVDLQQIGAIPLNKSILLAEP